MDPVADVEEGKHWEVVRVDELYFLLTFYDIRIWSNEQNITILEIL